MMEVYQPFLFPLTQSAVLPDPTQYFAQNLLSSPLPTNTFFQNFVLNNGSQPEYIHPYIIKSVLSTLSICYPSLFHNSSTVFQVFNPDISISTLKNHKSNETHVISAFSDLSVTLDYPSSHLRFFLVRGSPFLIFKVLRKESISISTINDILQISSNPTLTKHVIKLNNTQKWVLYASSPLHLNQSGLSTITTAMFSGIVRIAALPDYNPVTEATLDRFHASYPSSGHAVLSRPFSVEYRWEKKGLKGDLLMLLLPLHLKLLSHADCSVTVLQNLRYRSIDGDLVGVVVGDSLVLKTDPISVTWHSIKGVQKKSQDEIIAALSKDVESLSTIPIATNSSYFYGKLIARAARLALIAEEVSYLKVIPAIKKFLKGSIEPWLDGKFPGNGFLYDSKWGGIVTKLGSLDPTGDFGFGIYNDHHFHLGYFTYAISVLTKIDQDWGKKYMPKVYSLVLDYMSSSTASPNSSYTRVRCFDFWLLHSWAAGLTEFPNGRNQESTSEAINAYYSAALMGMAYGDNHLVKTGSTLLAFEIQSAITWWHVREDDTIYGDTFTRENRVVGILWSIKRDSNLWFAPAKWRECRLGIQVLPLLPITEVVFSDVEYAKQLVTWTLPALKRKGGVGEGWKGFIYALEGIYDRNGALNKIRKLEGYDDGNSLTNVLWWIHSRR